jgi:hypothetical protein
MQTGKKYWLGSPGIESTFILAPPLVSVLIVVIFSSYFTATNVGTFWWLLLVLGIDVSHVYSTLFRMYWDKASFTRYKKALVAIPTIALLVGVLVHHYSDALFWRILAYMAVFHFVRQQYGFMRLYSRNEIQPQFSRIVDVAAIYSATLYPILHWHLHSTGELNWFVQGDFLRLDLPWAAKLLSACYWIIILLYGAKEVYFGFVRNHVNIPKNLIVVGTYLSWYVGIVLYQADLLFTLVNVVSHGIPYMALIWVHGENKLKPRFSFNWTGVGIFTGVLLMLAYVEEYFWDVLVWRDHAELFPDFTFFHQAEEPLLLSLLVPILVLPQVTHYVLDGFIWRFSKQKII